MPSVTTCRRHTCIARLGFLAAQLGRLRSGRGRPSGSIPKFAVGLAARCARTSGSGHWFLAQLDPGPRSSATDLRIDVPPGPAGREATPADARDSTAATQWDSL